MTVCPLCHVTEPCWCEGIPPVERPVVAVEVALPVWIRPPGPVHGPAPARSSSTSSSRGRGHARCKVVGCGEEVPPGMLVCGRCADRLFLDLASVPGLAEALEAAHGKLLRFGVTRPAPAAAPEEESPLPFNAKASATTAILLDTLLAWVDRIAQDAGVDTPPLEVLRPMGTWSVVGAWLCAMVPWLRSSPLGPEAVAKLGAAVRAARLVVDRPPDLIYAGPCTASTVDADGLHTVCGADLYARFNELTVTCSECGARWPLSDRRRWLLGKVEDMLLPATELARAIDGLGVDVTPTLLRKWKERGRITSHGTDAHGHPVYRVGDVMDVVNAAAVRSAARR